MPVVAFARAFTLSITKDFDRVPPTAASHYYYKHPGLPRHVRNFSVRQKPHLYNTSCKASTFTQKFKLRFLPFSSQSRSRCINTSDRHVITSSLSRSPPPAKNVHVVILSNFAAHPMLAVRDRLSDPVFAVMLVVTAVTAFLVALIVAPRRKVSQAAASSAHVTNSPQVSTRRGSTMGKTEVGESPRRSFPPLAAPTPGESAIWLNMRFVTIISSLN